MPIKTIGTIVFAVGGLVVATPTFAASHAHRHHAARAAVAYAQPYGGYYGAYPYEGGIIARRTAEAYREPGLTLELAPDAKLTATGGPSGGIPGFSH